MNAPDARYANGFYELPSHARGVLVLADPPEAGWRIETLSDEQSVADRADEPLHSDHNANGGAK